MSTSARSVRALGIDEFLGICDKNADTVVSCWNLVQPVFAIPLRSLND